MNRSIRISSFLSSCLFLLTLLGCLSRGQELADRGDELLYKQRFEEAARQFELVLHECGDKTDDSTRKLRITTLQKIAELKHFYLNDQDGALRTYRQIMELSLGGEPGYKAHINVIKLMRKRSSDQSDVVTEIERLLANHPTRVDSPQWNIELAEIALRSRRYAETEKYARAARKTKTLKYRVEASLLLASAQELSNRIPDAIKTYRSLESESELGADVRQLVVMSVAHCLEKMGQLQEARKAYGAIQSSARDPEFVSTRIARIEKRLQETEKKKRPRKRLRRSRLRVDTSTEAEY